MLTVRLNGGWVGCVRDGKKASTQKGVLIVGLHNACFEVLKERGARSERTAESHTPVVNCLMNVTVRRL